MGFGISPMELLVIAFICAVLVGVAVGLAAVVYLIVKSSRSKHD